MNGVVKVEYHGTHYNHKNDVEYLTLTRKEREKIAGNFKLVSFYKNTSDSTFDVDF